MERRRRGRRGGLDRPGSRCGDRRGRRGRRAAATDKDLAALPHKETTWYGKKAKQYCLAQVLVAKAKKYASNAAFTIHNAKLKPYVQKSIPLGRILGWDQYDMYDGYYW